LVFNDHFATLVKFGVDLNRIYFYLEKNESRGETKWTKLDWLVPLSDENLIDGDLLVIKQDGVTTGFDSDDSTCVDVDD